MEFRDIFPLILARLSTKEIVHWSSSCKTYRQLCTDQFWKQIVLARWGKCQNKDNFRLEHHQSYQDDIKSFISMAKGNKFRELQTMIDKGIDINAIYQNQTALISAVIQGSLRSVKVLLHAGADPNRDFIVSPLIYASRYRHLEITRLLIKAGADVNYASSKGVTAINVSNHWDNFEIIKILLEAGADPNICNNSGANALISAVGTQSLETIKLLLQYNTDKQENACSFINKQNNNGQTALIIACKRGDRDIIKYLLDQGANRDLLDINNKKAFDYIRALGTRLRLKNLGEDITIS